MKKTYAAIAIMTLLTTSAPALGDVIVKDGRPRDVPYREVRYSDLNLDSTHGVDRLNKRILAAVWAVCGDADMRNLTEYMLKHQCRDASKKRAFADRDALLATRLAARGQPDKLAAIDASSLAVAAREAR